MKLLGCHVVDPREFTAELARIRTRAKDWVDQLLEMRRECRRSRKTWSEHDKILYLTIRRGLLLGQAQLRWLSDVGEFIEGGALPD